jgi:hypothetical protein
MFSGAMKLYGELAEWWPIVSTPADYAGEAALYRGILQAAVPSARQLLELGSGGGNNASHLKRWYEMTLVDVSPDMLRVSGALNPECAHHEGDMRTVRLGRTFDAVFVHDAIGYMLDERDLAAAIATVAAHTRPGGACLLVPDHTGESFKPDTGHGGHDDARSGRGVRYLDWSLAPASGETTHVTHYVFVLRERDGRMRVVHDEHRGGLFPRATWFRLLDENGFTATSQRLDYDDGASAEAFVGIRR